MKQYAIIPLSDNLLVTEIDRKTGGKKEGGVEMLGCATTRVVTAKNVTEACELAIKDALDELNGGNPFGPLLNSPSDPPIWEIDRVSEYELEDVVKAPRKGFTFYTPDKQ